MPVITLPDGSQRTYAEPISIEKVAADIGPGLAKAALAGKVDGKLVDTSYVIDRDVRLAIVTDRDPEGLEVIRHSTAHLLAQAVKQLFPDAQVTIGPVIEDGFYYDFAYKRTFTPEDLVAIEERMRDLAKADHKVTRRVMRRDDAVKFFRDQGEVYKAEIIASIPSAEEISLYGQSDWVDLCRGPHVPSTGKLRAFKLMKIAGAYWRGDSRNEMLQRIYGTAWPDDKQLKAYLTRLEEAEKRDHRKLGKEQDLFHFQEEAPGAVFWHPKGWTMFQALIAYMREKQRAAGYQEVSAPEIMDAELWRRSGHLEKFGENMFLTKTPDERTYAIKPMNCPGHIQVFKSDLRSYRDLPLRLAEFGKVHRYEPSGALHGLMRVRAFTQDDAHVFCTEAQITEEAGRVCQLLLDIYRGFGFHDVLMKLADRPPKRSGAAEGWDRAGAALKNAMETLGLPYTLNKGEGAFYGPKIEFVLRDAIGRDWQCGTLQVDLNMPGRLGATYIGEDGLKHTPVMLHRAIFGSLERFIGILLEHYAGALPFWRAPQQVVVATITSDADAYAREVVAELGRAGLRAEADLRNEKINYKVREHSLAKIPVILAAGKREVAERSVALRRLGRQDQTSLPLAAAVEQLRDEAAVRGASRPEAQRATR